MTTLAYYGARGFLAANIDSLATALTVTSDLSDALAVSFVNGTDVTYLSLRAGAVAEVVKVLDVTGNTLLVERGPTAYPFPAGTEIEYVVTARAVLDEIAESGVYPLPSLTGNGLVEVNNNGNNSADIYVPWPDFEGRDGIHIQGSWPNIRFGYSPPENDCCGPGGGGGGEGGSFDIELGGILGGYSTGNGYYINLSAPNFYGNNGITVSGEWPYYTLSLDAGGGGAGSGTVTSVSAASGLQITGNPNVNPTVSMQNTGVVAGDYAGFVINPRGQITQIPPSFNPISGITVTDGTLSVTRTGGNVTLAVTPAAVGQRGAVELADESDPFDPADASRAATPALVALALDTVGKSTVAGAAAYLGEPDNAYSNVISGSATPIELAAGEKAIVHAECTVLDGGTPTNIPTYGIGVFSTVPTRVQSNRETPQAQQSMSFVVSGPLNSTLALATTALGAGVNVVSWSLWIQKIG